MSTSAASCLLFLQSCSSIRQLLQIHAHMLRRRFLDDPFATTELLRSSLAFPFAGTLYARKLLAQIPHPTTFAWNSLLAALAASPSPASSLSFFRCMLSSGAIPNAHTFPPLVKACARLSDLTAGDQLHGLMIKCAAEHDVYSTNGLIHMYSACRRVDLGRRVFDTCTEHDAASWNCLLSGYVNCGLLDHARVVFDDMPQRGIISWNAMIHGYAKSGDITSARQLFDEMPERNVDSWNTLISAYGRCRRLDMSQKLFDEMPSRNAVSWSAMITAYAQGDCPAEALALFERMRRLDVMPNCATIVSLLSACSQMGALEQGRLIHSYIARNKMNVDSIIGTTLIDMYAKCGCVDSAVEVFDALVPKDVFSWTAMIGGLAVNGYAAKALELFDQMEMEGVKPNEVTFVAVLCACSHGGLVEQARYLFDSMRVVHGLKPQIEHYACMVDVLGRAGLLEEAISLVQSMPHYKAVLWEALFGACLIHGNAEMGQHIVDRLIELGLDDGGVYVLLANIYAMNGMWNDAIRTRMKMKFKSLSKIPAYSSFEVEGFSMNSVGNQISMQR
ncbi:pentatricopeptide repeat-containing protein At2g29760, chloroplastic-like [Zingiber officinale]|uniref:Chlororespiratory reduction 4 n=1 Tax=Zingiber officinale TaxID=94328 RepID=A0A8J5KFC6_ZINOF|nr:pentatricopeptide repeat-containing protein At2g29760, chloroplastic-like [Zingiber officinale]KAG6478979.1 hypothetical protein ZIOFF_062429 [Zingiber officinale]